MLLIYFVILLSIFQYGHCSLTLTLTDLENWKKQMRADLKEEVKKEIFLELPESEEIKRMNSKIHQVTKSNQEIITVVQDHGTKLDSFQEFAEKIQETEIQIENLGKDLHETKVHVENHSNMITSFEINLNVTEGNTQTQFGVMDNNLNVIKNSIDDLNDKFKVNQTKFQASIDEHFSKFDTLENRVNVMEENQEKLQITINNHSSKEITMQADVDQLRKNQNESLVVVNDQLDELENEINGLEMNQNETDLIIKNHTDQITDLENHHDLQAEQSHDQVDIKTTSEIQPNRKGTYIINMGLIF